MTQNATTQTRYHGTIEVGNLVHSSQVQDLGELFGVDQVVITEPIAEIASDTAPTGNAVVHFSGLTDQNQLDDLHDECMDIAYVANITVAPEGEDFTEHSARMISWSTRPIGEDDED